VIANHHVIVAARADDVTGGATQDITLKNLDMRFNKTYPLPIADMDTW